MEAKQGDLSVVSVVNNDYDDIFNNQVLDTVKNGTAEDAFASCVRYLDFSISVLDVACPIILERFPNERVFDENIENIKLFCRRGLPSKDKAIFTTFDEFYGQKNLSSPLIKDVRNQKHALDRKIQRYIDKIKLHLYGKPFDHDE